MIWGMSFATARLASFLVTVRCATWFMLVKY